VEDSCSIAQHCKLLADLFHNSGSVLRTGARYETSFNAPRIGEPRNHLISIASLPRYGPSLETTLGHPGYLEA
jgi:hypothetical protein